MATVTKLSGREEPFSKEKLAESARRAGLDGSPAAMEAVESVVKQAADRGRVSSWELADMLQLELLRRAVEDPRLADVARNHLLGRIYKEAFGSPHPPADYASAAREAWRRAGVEPPPISPRPEFDLLPYNALRLFTNGNYALRAADFRLAETPAMAAARVAWAVARDAEWAERYHRAITALRLVPASPFWFNALTGREMFASCFTLEVDDCLSSLTHPGRHCIYDALAYSGIIQQLGGGVGYDFSLLRPEGDAVRGSAGVASGAVSFMRLFDANVEVIKQGGKRRGAQMGTLHVWHPEVERFVRAKTGQLKDTHLQNFNISVFAEETFMLKALGLDPDPRYPLVNPRLFREAAGERPTELLDLAAERPGTGVVGWTDAPALFRRIVEGAWDSGDPGLVFKSNMNASNPLLGAEVEAAGYRMRYVWRAVNPCAETVQAPFEVCNLAHINLARFVRCEGDGTLDRAADCMDWEGLAEAARLGTRFLDDAIDRSATGIPAIDSLNRATRKNGLGVMGLAEALIRLGIPYASWEAVELVNRIMAWLYVHALEESARLARERGAFKYFPASVYARGELPVLRYQDFVWGRWGRIRGAFPAEVREAGDRLREITERTRRWLADRLEALREAVRGGVRNSVVLSVAPTGRTSILAGTTSGVEPVFALAFLRNVTVGTLVEYYWPAVEWLRSRGLWSEAVRRAVEEDGMLRNAPVPPEVKRLFATALEIGWLWHVLMQASAQQWVDQGISKTINMPANATAEDVYWAFAAAWAFGVKGITVYRDRSKAVQVIYTGLRAEIKRRLAVEVRPLALGPEGVSAAVEAVRLRALEEGRDPYCRTGDCS